MTNDEEFTKRVWELAREADGIEVDKDGSEKIVIDRNVLFDIIKKARLGD